MKEHSIKITGFGLKMIALISMLVDHASDLFFFNFCMNSDGTMVAGVPNLIYGFMEIVGRFAFPIYCYLIVEGFFHTRSVKKYAVRLFIFALVSEIPYDLKFNGSFFDFSTNNVFFTLFMGLLMIWGLDAAKKRFGEDCWKNMRWQGWMLSILILAAGVTAAHFLNADYTESGVLAIAVLYLFHSKKNIAFALSVAVLTAFSCGEISAILMLVPIMMYNGERGKQMKYFFYAFYPVHLMILYLLGLVWMPTFN